MIERIESIINTKANLVLIVVIVIAACLRLYHINYQSLWLDELYTIVPTDPNNSLQSIIDYCKGDQPPLFFLYIHYLFKIFGYSEAVGRVASAFLGLISIVAIYLLAKECFGKMAGICASIITSVNFFHIYYSQELRFYSMAFLLATLSYFFYIRVFKHGKLVNFFGYAIATICLLYTHYFGLIVFGTQGLIFLILVFRKREVKFILLSISSAMIIAIAFIPWMPIVFNDLGGDVGWIEKPDPSFVLQYFYAYTGKDIVTTTIYLILLYISFFVKQKVNELERPLFFVLILWIVMVYLLPYIRSIILSPMLHERYTIVALPAWIILFSHGWSRISNLKWKYAALVVLILSGIINTMVVRSYYTRLEKDQFREVSQIVLLKNEPHYPIYSKLAWHFSYYFRNYPVIPKNIGQADLSEVQKFWLLQSHATEEEREAEINSVEGFEVIERHSLFGANAILMERK
jgi:mannosyltransferase